MSFRTEKRQVIPSRSSDPPAYQFQQRKRSKIDYIGISFGLSLLIIYAVLLPVITIQKNHVPTLSGSDPDSLLFIIYSAQTGFIRKKTVPCALTRRDSLLILVLVCCFCSGRNVDADLRTVGRHISGIVVFVTDNSACFNCIA